MMTFTEDQKFDREQLGDRTLTAGSTRRGFTSAGNTPLVLTRFPTRDAFST